MTPDDLYALPLAEFTAARNKLAKESGDKSIAKLRKPNAPAWALNQAARSHKGDVARFLHAAAGVRGSATRAALDDLRQAEADVRRAALRHLGSTTHLAAVNDLLSAAAMDETVADLLRRGVLTGAEEAGELSPFALSGPVPADDLRAAREERRAAQARHPTARRKAPANDDGKDDDAAAARQAARREKARQKAAEAADAAKDAEREAHRLEREAAALEEKAAKARAHADSARAKADEARRKADELHEAARG